MLHGNLLTSLPPTGDAEVIDALVTRRSLRLERIISHGHASPPGFWYDQDQHEFVFLVAGHAELEFEDRPPLALGPGDWVQIDAHVRHRVRATAPDADTIWLVAFFDANRDAGETL
jgi:cupin 2 domain-containing protein